MKRLTFQILLVLLAFGTGQALAAATPTTTVTASWTDMSTNEDGFKLQRKVDTCAGSVAWTALGQVGANVATYMDATVKEGTHVAYRVDAYNTAGESAWSNCAEISKPYTAASSPTNLAVTQAGVMTWTVKTDNDAGILVQRKGGLCAAGGSFADLATTNPSVGTFTDANLTQGQSYCYRAAATNPLGNSPFSATAELTVSFTVPGAPSNLLAQ